MSKQSNRRQPTLVDLFAGCGGLSLGLENAGFQPVYVNELDHDAMATYLGNRIFERPDLLRYHSNDIFDLTGHPDRDRADAQIDGLAAELRGRYGDIDLVAGGPPCQGYSGIGHRRSFELSKVDIPSNHLYREMATVVRALQPKMFLFENVRGLLSAKWTPDDREPTVWPSVLEAFGNLEGYEIYHALVQAKQYGVPQNRPRVLLAGIRENLGFTADNSLVAAGLLPQPSGRPPHPRELLGDLVDDDWEPGGISRYYPIGAHNETQRRLRLDRQGVAVARKGAPLTQHVYSKHASRILAKFQYMLENDGAIRDVDQTKKFAQRVIPLRWGDSGPSMTATSLPDDYVHFSQPRTPTVREWARFQTFPDWYDFVGKRTTGGRRRAGDPDVGQWSRDLPVYTQIGNAVPVWLAEALGRHFRNVLSDGN